MNYLHKDLTFQSTDGKNIIHAELIFSIVKFSINVLRTKDGTKTVFSSFASTFDESDCKTFSFTSKKPITINEKSTAICEIEVVTIVILFWFYPFCTLAGWYLYAF